MSRTTRPRTNPTASPTTAYQAEGTDRAAAPYKWSGTTVEAEMDECVSRDEAWMRAGLCRDIHPSTFFPSDGVGVEKARMICADCPVRAECLEYALVNRIDHGVWGGASERERRRILRSRRIAAAAAASAAS